jgi:hypothetical protein
MSAVGDGLQLLTHVEVMLEIDYLVWDKGSISILKTASEMSMVW